MSFLLNYCLKMCLGLLAFWVGETGGIIQAYAVVTMFLAGSIIPLDLMPAAVERVTHFLPFPLPLLLPGANPAGPTGLPISA